MYLRFQAFEGFSTAKTYRTLIMVSLSTGSKSLIRSMKTITSSPLYSLDAYMNHLITVCAWSTSSFLKTELMLFQIVIGSFL